jgi:hypothetical protein
MVENHHREEAEEKLAKVEEKITQAAADLETYKNLARELKEKNGENQTVLSKAADSLQGKSSF